MGRGQGSGRAGGGYARLSERTIEEVYRPSPQDMAAQAFLLEKLGYRDPYDEDGDEGQDEDRGDRRP